MTRPSATEIGLGNYSSSGRVEVVMRVVACFVNGAITKKLRKGGLVGWKGRTNSGPVV